MRIYPACAYTPGCFPDPTASEVGQGESACLLQAGEGETKGDKGGGRRKMSQYENSLMCLLLGQKETQSWAGMPGTLRMEWLYADRRWKAYSNNKTPVA